MAKKKPDPKKKPIIEDAEPPRVGDATEYDMKLNAEDIPPAAAAEAGGMDFDLLQPAGEGPERILGASAFNLPDDDAPRVGDVTEATYDEIDLDVPTASVSASSSNLFGTGIPSASLADSASNLEPVNLEPVSPVQPASGWFDSDEVQPPKAVSTDAIDEIMAQPATGALDDASDIFAGPVPAALPKSDVSDVIAATAYRQAKPADGEKRNTSSRASDVALNFDRPPGGSTIESLSAGAELPVAEEAADSLFDEPIDSGRFAKAANDSPDFGASPAGGIDASSILADLSEPGSMPGDSSAIRLEAPGMEATLRAETDPPKFSRDSTELDMDLPDADEVEPTHWHSQSGSDLFGAKTEFELTPDAGTVDPFGDELDVDQPSLSSAPSSIFSGGKPLKGAGSGQSSGGSVPVANPESSADSVEFSDHPDPNAADSGSFHVLPAGAAGAVDFDMPAVNEDAYPERSMMAHIPEDDDWTNAKTDPGVGASGILSRKKKIDPTDEMAPIPATPVKGKNEKKPAAAKVVPWSDDATEEEPALPKQRREPKPEQTSKRGLAGLALGLLLGVGASAGTYFSGVLPNKEVAAPSTKGSDSPPAERKPYVGKIVFVEDPQLQAKYTAAMADLTTALERVTKAEKDAADEKGRVVRLAGDVTAEKENTLKVEKELKGLLATQTKLATDLKGMTDTLAADLKTEKEKAITADKLAVAEKEKAVKAEKDLTGEKGKVAALEKDVKAEKDNVLKVEKDYKAMLDKFAVDSKKDIDTAKADLIKAQDLLKAETTERAKLAEAVKVEQANVVAIRKEMQAAKLLDLSKLIPADLSAVAGTGLSTGHILDLASRTNKADAATKAANAKIQELKDEQSAEIKSMIALLKKTETTLKDAHAVELKKTADGYAVETKKASDAAAITTDKLKADLKKAADATALEVKKATDAAAVAMDKLKAEQAAKLKEETDARAVQVKSLESAVTAEKVKTAEAERRFKALGGAAELASQELDRQAALAAARNRDAGIAAYKSGRYTVAITALEEAAKHDPNDPLAWYFLGATRWAQGKPEDAMSDYKKGAEREVLRLVPTRQIDTMIGAIQGSARDALTAIRP